MFSSNNFKPHESHGLMVSRGVPPDAELVQRAREAAIMAHPRAPLFVRRLIRSGRLDWLLASARQAMRDIEKPVEFLTHEARAAWVLNNHASLMDGMSQEARRAVAQITVTAVRVAANDAAPPPHAVIHGAGLSGWIVAAVVGAVAIVGVV